NRKNCAMEIMLCGTPLLRAKVAVQNRCFMFEWLIDEMARVQTQKFYLVDGPASPELHAAVAKSDFPLPPSYREFVLRFGNSKLYRRDSYYYVTVFAGPRELEADDGERLIQFGRTWTSLAYFKESLLVAGSESPVFEWQHEQCIRQTADGFEKWLELTC